MVDIAALTQKLLREHNVAAGPVPVYNMVRDDAIQLIFEPMDDSDSGFLLLQNNRATIAVNSSHHPNRQRFTAAHEWGHFKLHRKGDDQLFVDQAFQRGPEARAGTNFQEVEANRFAANLLMPEAFLRSAAGAKPLSDLDIALLALRFEVSEQAMTLRLVNLSLVDPKGS